MEIYANLNRGGVSIRQMRKVIGCVAVVRLSDVTFKISRPSEQQRAIREKKRNVHAVACGTLCEQSQEKIKKEDLEKLRRTYKRVRYNPFRCGYFTVDGEQILEAGEVLMVLGDLRNEKGRPLCEMFLIRG